MSNHMPMYQLKKQINFTFPLNSLITDTFPNTTSYDLSYDMVSQIYSSSILINNS